MILRSPPFPGVAPAVAAIGTPGAPTEPSPSIEALFEAISAARVGGTFWARPVSGERPAALYRPAHRADVKHLLRRQEPAMWLLPDQSWAYRLARTLRRRGTRVEIGEVDPWSLLQEGAELHAHGDDEWSALALIAGCPVHPLSEGRYSSRDSVARALLEVAHRDPFFDRPATIGQAIAQLGDWRRAIAANHNIAAAAGIAWWKRDAIRRFLWAPRPMRFLSSSRAIAYARKRGGALAIWPAKVTPGLAAEAEVQGVPLVRIEDGFVRSVGLGSDLFPPLSVSVDASGIYYDPTRPSDLETLLETAPFLPDLLERAEALRQSILAHRISKYGSGADDTFPEREPGRPLILVTGQVEDDMSVRQGGGDVTGNLDLLRRARALEPEAEIWFRPHPDVDAGHRKGAVPDADALRYADRVVRGGGMAALLERIDALHVWTSLTGFEALLRGIPVTCHGTPFFAGWGLTVDRASIPARRTRTLSLAELVAGTLLLYPRYLDPETGLLCPAEVLIERFARQVRPKPGLLNRLRRLQGGFMRARR